GLDQRDLLDGKEAFSNSDEIRHDNLLLGGWVSPSTLQQGERRQSGLFVQTNFSRQKRTPPTRAGLLQHLADHRLSTGFTCPIAAPACLTAAPGRGSHWSYSIEKSRFHVAVGRHTFACRAVIFFKLEQDRLNWLRQTP